MVGPMHPSPQSPCAVGGFFRWCGCAIRPRMKSSLVLAMLCALISPANQKHNGETKADAEARYDTIAEVIAAESMGDRRLAMYLVTIAYHEASLSRAVHDGSLGGDCKLGKDGKPIIATCKSWCLMQINLGRPLKPAPFTGYTRKQLVGLDIESTRRCVETGARFIRVARKTRCKRTRSPACIFAAYGGVKSLDDPRILTRVRTFKRLARIPLR